VYDVDASHPVVEAHVRMYAIRKDRPVPRPLRILQPDDDLGSTLFLSMPNVVAHHIDRYSILHPPGPTPLNSSGIMLRQADSYVGNREGIICPICGESYGTPDRWIRHVRYQRIVEAQDNYPVEGTHLSLREEDLMPRNHPSAPVTDLEKLRTHFRNEVAEVIVVVEGIDPLMSGTFQALQSYRFEDVIFNNAASFHPCVSVGGADSKKRRNWHGGINRCSRQDENEKLVVDLDRFHDIDVPEINSNMQRLSLRTHDSFMEDGCCCEDDADIEKGCVIEAASPGNNNNRRNNNNNNNKSIFPNIFNSFSTIGHHVDDTGGRIGTNDDANAAEAAATAHGQGGQGNNKVRSAAVVPPPVEMIAEENSTDLRRELSSERRTGVVVGSQFLTTSSMGVEP